MSREIPTTERRGSNLRIFEDKAEEILSKPRNMITMEDARDLQMLEVQYTYTSSCPLPW